MKLQTVVIDDSLLQRITTAHFVEKHPDLELIGSYEDPKAGLAKVVSSKVDLVILDIEMPGINGFELMNCLNPEVQVILNSTLASYADTAMQFGATAFLQKPLQKQKFNAAITEVSLNIAVIKLLEADVRQRKNHTPTYQHLKRHFETLSVPKVF